MKFVATRKHKSRFTDIHKANNAVNAEQASVHRLSDLVEPQYKREFIMAVVEGDDSINRAALNRAIGNGDIDASLNALGIERFATRTAGLGILFSDITRRGAKNAEQFLKPGIQRRFSFDPFSEVAARITRERSAALVANVTDESRTALEAVLNNARRQGLTTPETGRLAANVLGLNERQGIALGNLRSSLVEQGLKSDVIESRLKRQSSQFLAQRARTIARTESTAALNGARNLVWGQLQDQGLVEPIAEKQWITARDERVCEICGPLDNETVPVAGTFSSEVGDLDSPPAHPNCRCTITLRSDGTTGRRPAWPADAQPPWKLQEDSGLFAPG